MTQSRTRELEFDVTGRYVAYDASTGEVLLTHDVMNERGAYEGSGETADVEAVQQMACRDFEKRQIKVLRLPREFEWKPEASYRVDPGSEELVEVSSSPMTFREFVGRERRTKDEYP